MREISNDLIAKHADVRFRSEYDYALFEYYRSAKVLALLDQAGVRVGGRVLDVGCGGGGMPLSLAEHADFVVGIDPMNRFGDAGVVLARERGLGHLHFTQADGMALPFRDASFDLVLSHAVIEHVARADDYLAECRRVIDPDGRMYLSTAPYLSFAGAHLPRLKIPIPLHLIVGRWMAFRTFRWLARRAPGTLREAAHQNSFIKLAQQGVHKEDDLLELVRIRRLRQQITDARFRIDSEHLHLTGTFRNLPGPLPRWLESSALTQDIVIGHVQYVLVPA